MTQFLNQPLRTLRSATHILGSLFLGAVLALQLWVLPATATGVYQMPPLSAGSDTWVVDQADVLSRLTQGSLSSRLQQLAESTGDEVRFVAIRRLDYGETAQSFTDQLFETWFPSPEAQEHEVLIVLDTVTNTSAIRVGAAVGDRLTAEIAASVAQETLQVPLRQGDKYNQAFLDASDRLATVLSGNPDPGPPILENTVNVESTFTSAEETDVFNSTIIVIIILIAATIIPMVTYFIYVR